MNTEEDSKTQDTKKMTLGQEIFSVLSAFFGVQSKDNRERDFSRGSAKRFIALGLIGTIVFIFTVSLIVKVVLQQAGI